MSEQQRVNPLVLLIENAETEEYRHEVAVSTAVYYEQRLGSNHPGVFEIKKIAIMSAFGKARDSIYQAQQAWDKERAALSFWKKLRTPHIVSESYVEEWVEAERMRAFMDVSSIIALRENEL